MSTRTTLLAPILLLVTLLLRLHVPVHAAPLSARANTTVTSLSSAALAALLRPARFARVAYCDSPVVRNLTCGAPCAALGPDVDVLVAGGDNTVVPAFYVAHDRAQAQVVVAHQGTNTDNLESVLNDLQLGKSPVNATRFPNASATVEVHDGFQRAQAASADTILSTVQNALADAGTNNLLVVGHSLGASIALLDALMLKMNLPAEVNMTTVLFGLPRTGNQAFADLVDSTLGGQFTHVSNDQDPVVQVPPFALGFQHPAGEVHIRAGNATVACAGQENESCSRGSVLDDSVFQDHKGPYFKAAIPMGGGSCPGFQHEKDLGFFAGFF